MIIWSDKKMKQHSTVDVITNSSSTTYIYPKENATSKVDELFYIIQKVIKEQYGHYIDFSSIVQSKVVPNKDWTEDQKFERKYKYADMSDEEFEEFIQNPKNAEYDGFPITELMVKIGEEDISDLLKLYTAMSTYEG